MPRALFFLVCLWGFFPQSLAQEPLQALSIQTQEGKVIALQVEIADNPLSRRIGLMHRESLSENHGMLFLYPYPQKIMMWMKNTLLSLDMIFIGEGGKILRIAPERTPFSLEKISSEEPAVAVLELLGGSAEKMGLRTGDTVRIPE